VVKRARKRLCCVPDERLKQKERDTDECAPAVMTRGEEGVVEKEIKTCMNTKVMYCIAANLL